MLKIGLSYLKVKILPKRKENSLEDFMINRFGVELYKTFFKEYTEKLWGVPCNKISPEWQDLCKPKWFNGLIAKTRR